MKDIPDWLSHLRRDRRGIPVPYVNRWGDENLDLISIKYDENVRKPGVFFDDSKNETPDFTAQNMQRQRQCMTLSWCQVCARIVRPEHRTLVIAQSTVETIDLNGKEHVAVFEPWLCHRCAMFAIDRCPALIRRKADDNLTLVPVPSDKDFALVVSTGWVDGPLEAESKEIMPAMWVKAILHPRLVRIEME